MTYPTESDRREAIATALEDAGWHGPAGDVREGVSIAEVMRRVAELGLIEPADIIASTDFD
jgi:hypothetical protein